MAVTVCGLDHVNIRTSDVLATGRFFADILDMKLVDPPGMNDRNRAVWICDIEDRPVLHVNHAEISSLGSGHIHHVALRCSGHAAMIDRLNTQDIAFSTNDIPQIGVKQIFIKELNGILLELNFVESLLAA